MIFSAILTLVCGAQALGWGLFLAIGEPRHPELTLVAFVVNVIAATVNGTLSRLSP